MGGIGNFLSIYWPGGGGGWGGGGGSYIYKFLGILEG